MRRLTRVDEFTAVVTMRQNASRIGRASSARSSSKRIRAIGGIECSIFYIDVDCLGRPRQSELIYYCI